MSLMAWLGQSALPLILLGLGSLLIGLVGIMMRVRGGAHEGPGWDGSSYEMQFIIGTLIALIFCPIGIAVLGYVWLWR